MDIDHVVLWVQDPNRSVAFYIDVLGLTPVRLQDFKDGKARFPSVRLNERTIFDLMDGEDLLSLVQDFTGGGDGIGGAPINHVCLSVDAQEYVRLTTRLEEHGVKLTSGGENAFGAQGQALRSVYFSDPDGNVLELRHYDELN